MVARKRVAFAVLFAVAVVAICFDGGPIALADAPVHLAQSTKPPPPTEPPPPPPPTDKPPPPTEPAATDKPPPPTEPGATDKPPPPTEPPSTPTPTPTRMPGPPLVTSTPTPTPTGTPAPTETPTPTPIPVISGQVFDDQDGDGVQGPDEPGVAGIAVALDEQVVGATDTSGRFTIELPGGRRALLSIVAPDGWQWVGEPVSTDDILERGIVISLCLRRVDLSAPIPPAVTVTGGVLIAVVIAVLAFNGFAWLTQAAAIGHFDRSYRLHKSLELEQLRSQEVAQRRAQVEALLEQPDGWRKVMGQVLADALPGSEHRMAQAEIRDASVVPAPRFTVAGAGGQSYLFTTAPTALREAGVLKRREDATLLDAAVHPTARIEVQAVWDSLKQELAHEDTTLPRDASWYLATLEAAAWRPRMRQRWWRRLR